MNVLTLLKDVRMVALDVDGVLTNGTLLLLENGQQARTMHIRDGYALQLAVKQGLKIVIISGAEDRAVVMRLQKLGITDIHTGVSDKKSLLTQILHSEGFQRHQVAFMGDDLPDLGVMRDTAIACCPQDAATEILAVSAFISEKKGGEGCVRDLIEKILRLQGQWHPEESVRSL
jgi:3-deoxy-D-manno-octulosonate 8-phosphate phosphatase (KDO 8-P phosphatase)